MEVFAVTSKAKVQWALWAPVPLVANIKQNCEAALSLISLKLFATVAYDQ